MADGAQKLEGFRRPVNLSLADAANIAEHDPILHTTPDDIVDAIVKKRAQQFHLGEKKILELATTDLADALFELGPKRELLTSRMSLSDADAFFELQSRVRAVLRREARLAREKGFADFGSVKNIVDLSRARAESANGKLKLFRPFRTLATAAAAVAFAMFPSETAKETRPSIQEVNITNPAIPAWREEPAVVPKKVSVPLFVSRASNEPAAPLLGEPLPPTFETPPFGLR